MALFGNSELAYLVLQTEVPPGWNSALCTRSGGPRHWSAALPVSSAAV